MKKEFADQRLESSSSSVHLELLFKISSLLLSRMANRQSSTLRDKQTLTTEQSWLNICWIWDHSSAWCVSLSYEVSQWKREILWALPPSLIRWPCTTAVDDHFFAVTNVSGDHVLAIGHWLTLKALRKLRAERLLQNCPFIGLTDKNCTSNWHRTLLSAKSSFSLSLLTPH